MDDGAPDIGLDEWSREELNQAAELNLADRQIEAKVYGPGRRPRANHYVLDKHNQPVPVSMGTWAIWNHHERFARRQVGDTRWHHPHWGRVRVSTVFLGLDHNHFGNGPPILFETMIFMRPRDIVPEKDWEQQKQYARGNTASPNPFPPFLHLWTRRVARSWSDWQRRYHTWGQALAGHYATVRLTRAYFNKGVTYAEWMAAE